MQKIAYYPILKCNQGELTALRELQCNDRHFIPIIEVSDVEITPSMFFDSMNRCFAMPFYFDTERCEDDVERSFLQAYVIWSKERGIVAWPILYPDDLFQGDDIISLVDRFAVRIPFPMDYDGPGLEELLGRITEIASEKTVDVIFDADAVTTKQTANSVYAEFLRIFKYFPGDLQTLNKIVVCLTSFPIDISNIEAGDDAEYERHDIKIFCRLLSKLASDPIGKKLAYSDYGVTKFTDTDIDFRLMKYGILPKVKYTTQDKYYVLKGEKNRTLGTFTRSYIDLAKAVYESDYYYGDTFSFGDSIIAEKATSPNARPGNSTLWVGYCVSHHLAVLNEQLSNPNELLASL